MEFKLSKESLLKVSLGSALFALIMGVMAISVTLFCRVAGGQDYLDLYYWSLSAHGLSMLVLWVPSIVAYFYINQNTEILENKKMTSFLFFGLSLFVFSQFGIFISYFFLQATRLTPFILTPNSRVSAFFLLLNTFSQVIIFSTLSFAFVELLKNTKVKNKRFVLYVGAFTTLTMAINATFSHVFLQRGFLSDEWSQHLWLPLGHFSMQAVTMTLFALWSTHFFENQEWLYRTRLFLFIGYPVFVFLGYLNLFPELLKTNEVGHWDDHYVWIPAISSLFLTLLFIFSIFRFFKKENLFYLISFLMFSVVGGLTGLEIATDLLFKTRVLGTLFMPGHFHPLLLGGFTFSMLVYLLSNIQALKAQAHKFSRFFLWSLFLGVLSFSSFLMYLGLDRSLRRHPVLADVRFHNLSWVLLGLAGLAVVSLLFLVSRIVVLKFKNYRKI